MNLDKKILKEIERHHKINRYITEQALPPEGDLPPTPEAEPAVAPEAAPVDPSIPPQKIDVATDSEVTKIDDEGKSEEKIDDEGSEELDVTDLVDSQKNIEKKQEDYFENLFGQISKLESKSVTIWAKNYHLKKIHSLEIHLNKLISPHKSQQIKNLKRSNPI